MRIGSFFPSLLQRRRGIAHAHGTPLVISDAHIGPKSAIAAVMVGAARQRGSVHLLRNVLAQVPKGSAEVVAAAIRTIVAQPDAEHVRDQLDVIASMLGRQFPQVEAILRDKNDIFTSAFVALFEGLVEQALSALHQPGSTVEQLDGFLQRYAGDLWERMATSPYAEEIIRSKNAEVVAAVGTVVARLSDGLTAYLEQRSADTQARAEWVELLRWSPKGFSYDRPSVATFRRRLTALARVVATDLDAP